MKNFPWHELARQLLEIATEEHLKPPKQQKQPQKWVIETLRLTEYNGPHQPQNLEWQMASELMASGRNEDADRMITPRRLETAINILKAHQGRYLYHPEERQFRIRNIKTGEIIPWEAIGNG